MWSCKIYQLSSMLACMHGHAVLTFESHKNKSSIKCHCISEWSCEEYLLYACSLVSQSYYIPAIKLTST